MTLKLGLLFIGALAISGCARTPTAELALQDAALAATTSTGPASPSYASFQWSEEKIAALEAKAKGGDRDALLALANYFTKPYSLPHPKGLKWLKAGAEAGDASAMRMYAMVLDKDTAHCPEAVRWARQSVEAVTNAGYELELIVNYRSLADAVEDQCRQVAS